MSNDNGGGWLATVAACYIGYLVIVGAWHSKLRYFIQYAPTHDVGWDQITKDKIPHDCDWLSSPLGDKNCHYDAVVHSLRTSKDKSSSKPIYSIDDGKTWRWTDPDYSGQQPEPFVTIGWEKVND